MTVAATRINVENNDFFFIVSSDGETKRVNKNVVRAGYLLYNSSGEGVEPTGGLDA